MADRDYRVVTACRLCDSEQLTEALNLGETPLANELDGTELFPLVVNLCESCGHHQLSIAVKPQRLWGPSYPYQSGTSPVWRKHLESLGDEVRSLVPTDNNSRYEVLEIASNDGTLVDILNERGLGAWGIDPSGPNDPKRSLATADWPKASKWMDYHFGMTNPLDFQCIIALHVMAHVDDLHSFTAAVKEALAPDGIFIVEVGELQHFDTIYHEHMSYHDAESFGRFLNRHGLAVDRVERNSAQGGSLRFYARHF